MFTENIPQIYIHNKTTDNGGDEIISKERMIEVCPICGSSELYYEVGGSIGKVYHCKDCNYIGALVVEANEEMIKAIKEEYERRKEEG